MISTSFEMHGIQKKMAIQRTDNSLLRDVGDALFFLAGLFLAIFLSTSILLLPVEGCSMQRIIGSVARLFYLSAVTKFPLD